MGRIALGNIALLVSITAPLAAQQQVVWDATLTQWDRAEIGSVPVEGGTIEVAALRNKRIPDTFGIRSSFVQIRLQRGSRMANVVVPSRAAGDLRSSLRARDRLPMALLDIGDGPTLIVRARAAGVGLEFACAASGCRPASPANYLVLLDDTTTDSLGRALLGAVRAFGENARMPHVGDTSYPLAAQLRDLDSVDVFGAIGAPGVADDDFRSAIMSLMADSLAAVRIATAGRNRSAGVHPSLTLDGRCIEDGNDVACRVGLHVMARIRVRRTGESSFASIWSAGDTLFVTPRAEARTALRGVAERMMAEFGTEYRLVTPRR